MSTNVPPQEETGGAPGDERTDRTLSDLALRNSALEAMGARRAPPAAAPSTRTGLKLPPGQPSTLPAEAPVEAAPAKTLDTRIERAGPEGSGAVNFPAPKLTDNFPIPKLPDPGVLQRRVDEHASISPTGLTSPSGRVSPRVITPRRVAITGQTSQGALGGGDLLVDVGAARVGEGAARARKQRAQVGGGVGPEVMYGLGVRISDESPHKVVDVSQLVDEHGREVAGNVIHVGDTLLQVDKVDVASMPLEHLRAMIYGRYGTGRNVQT
ncbi:hypothetical protein T484DRAFT_1906782 [Baffinella frigidus]|nr:hypothetical protein T484DRAFT_1906782 [Cryptophyta sp. CCMP2293]